MRKTFYVMMLIGCCLGVCSAPLPSNAGTSTTLQNPVPKVYINGQSGLTAVSSGTSVDVNVSLSAGAQEGTTAYWWVAAKTPYGWYSLTTEGWLSEMNLLAQYPLFSFSNAKILDGSLPTGDYAFYFAVDTDSTGTESPLFYYDKAQLHVSNSSGIDISSFAASKAESASTYDSADSIDNTTFDDTVLIDFTANTAQLSTGDPQQITSAGISLTSEISIALTTYGITLVSTSANPVKYILSGTLSGTLTVSSSGKYCLYLNNVTINASSGPAISLESESKAFIVSAPDSTNTLTDAATSSTMKKKGALHSEGSMIFSGNGQLNVNGNYKHGIYCNDYIRIQGGELDVAVTARDAIRSVNAFIFDDGKLTINATGTTIDDESKGVKVEGLEGEGGAGKGYVVINGGYITITSVGKAISAGWDIDEDSETTSTLDDPNPYVEINNGVLIINTTGTPYEYLQDGETVSCSPEGIEGKSSLTVNSAYMIINTTDDAFNAGNSITINGGYIYAASSANDSIDSNGTLTITGGVIVAIGAEIPESAFDSDKNTFKITGGTFVGIAGDTSTPTSNVCTQNAIIYKGLPTGNTMSLQSADGSVVFAYQIPRSYSTMLFSSPKITTGTKYSLITGGTANGDQNFYGLHLGNLTSSGGSTNTTFTVTSTVTDLKNR